jgi:predicted Zn finger-like uncharacterized protein
VVITCEQCTTSFQLDDSRVPEKGVRVRCSRCQHAFFVKPSAESGMDPVESVVSDAVVGSAGDSSDDLSGAQGQRTSADLTGRTEAPGDFIEAPESDWEFNHDDEDSGHGAKRGAAEDMVDDLLGADSIEDVESATKAALFGSLDDGDVGTEVEDEIAALLGDSSQALEIDAERSATGDAIAAATDPEEAPEPVFGALADDAELPDLRTPSGLDLEAGSDLDVTEDAADGSEVAPALRIAVEAAAEPAAPPAMPASPMADSLSANAALAGLAEEELGSPDEWDFFADSASAAESASARASDAPGPQTVLTQVQPVPASNFEAALGSEDLPVLEREPSRLAATLGRFGSAVGWFVTLSLVVGGLWTGLEPRPALQARDTADHALDAVHARRIDNAVDGQILVVEGVLRPADIATGGSGKRFAVQLLDASGAVLVADAASFGPALSEADLRETVPLALREAAAAEAMAAAWGPVADSPGRTLHAVVTDLPPSTSHLRVVHVAVDPPSLPAEPEPAPAAEDSPGEGLADELATTSNASAASI